jgi:hypothetical protein
MPGSAEVRYICVANRLQRCVPAARARLPIGHAASREELSWTKTVPRDRPLRKACRMTDEQLALQAVSDAQRILEEYLEPRPHNNERIILDKLVEVLERPDLLVAVGRMQRSA